MNKHTKTNKNCRILHMGYGDIIYFKDTDESAFCPFRDFAGGILALFGSGMDMCGKPTKKHMGCLYLREVRKCPMGYTDINEKRCVEKLMGGNK